MSTQYFEGVGRRKTSTARVRIYPGGSGNVVVNDKALEEYFPREGDTIEGIKLLKIAEESVTVEHNRKTMELKTH